MPNANFALGNTYDTITRPVAFAIAKDCLRRMGFPEAAYTDFIGHTQTSTQQDSTLTPQDNKNFFGSNAEAILQIEEEPIKDRIYEASVLRMDNEPIFRDESINTFIRPVYSPTQVTLNFRLRFTDEVQANRWRDDLVARSHLLRHEQLHQITYHYIIPSVFLVILSEIFKLKEKVDQTGEQFGQWTKKNFDPRTSSVSNLAGKELTMILPEDQGRVLGWFEFSGFADKPTLNKDNGTWDVEWQYSYVYDKPIEAVMTYPLVIRQQMLGQAFRPAKGEYAPHRTAVQPNTVNRTLGRFFDTRTPPKGILDNRYPEFDTWEPEGGVEGCEMLWIGLVTITKDDRRTLLNLDQLGVHKLSDAARAFILSERQFVCDPARSIIEVGVYSNNARALPGQVTIDENLNVVATMDISMEPVYHVVVSVRRDMSSIMPEDYDRIRHKACGAYDVLAFLYPDAVKHGLIPKPNRRCVWTIDEWQYIVELTRPPRPGLNRPWPVYPGKGGKPFEPGKVRRIMQTLGHFHLITRRD